MVPAVQVERGAVDALKQVAKTIWLEAAAAAVAAVAVLLLLQSVPEVPEAQAAAQAANLVLTTMVMFKAAVVAAVAAAGQTAAAVAAAELNVPTLKIKMTTNRMAVAAVPAVLSVPLVVPGVVVIALEPKDMESITIDMMPNPEPAVPVDME